jgi:uncharacterized protein (TIGR02679 family)
MPLDPALHRTLVRARERRERRGAAGDATFTLENLSDAEALALDGLLSPKKTVLPSTTRRFSVSALEAGLRQIGIDPREAYEAVGDGRLRDRPAERAAAQRGRERFHEWVLAHPTGRARPAIGAWLADAARQGRITAELRPIVERALRIVDSLPPQVPVQRSVLAARLIDDDPHALDPGTALHSLAVSLLAADGCMKSGTPPRAVWANWNVQVDSISSNVAALNLPLLGDSRLAQTARLLRGTAMVLTHGQLTAGELRWPGEVHCFTCENPAIVLGAEQELGTDCPPLICTGGRPSYAVRLLLSSLHRAGARIRHHGDFDDAGVQILRDLELRYGAVPWRFDAGTLRAALLRHGRPVQAPWPATLEEAVGLCAKSFPEELMIDDLIDDLRRLRTTGRTDPA